jgi:hypothetical protein
MNRAQSSKLKAEDSKVGVFEFGMGFLFLMLISHRALRVHREKSQKLCDLFIW